MTSASGGGPKAATGRRRGSSYTTTTLATSSAPVQKAPRVTRRGMTVMYVRLTNFEDLLKVGALEAITAYCEFVEAVYPAINEHMGTASLDGDALLIHWNTARPCASARMQACQLAVKLVQVSQRSALQLSIGIAFGQGTYTSVGCDALSALTVLGPLVPQAHLLQQIAEQGSAAILVDEAVRDSGPHDALFLVDVISSSRWGGRPVRLFQLIPEALTSTPDYDGEWLYAFSGNAAVTDAVALHQLWSRCVQTFYDGSYSQAQPLLEQYLTSASTLASTQTQAEPARKLLAAIGGLRSCSRSLGPQPPPAELLLEEVTEDSRSAGSPSGDVSRLRFVNLVESKVICELRPVPCEGLADA
eukprot:RCo001230